MTAEHGTRSRYVHGCHCGPCTAANREYGRDYNRLTRKIRPSQYVDAAPVVAHVEMLRACGVGWQRIGAVAGVPASTMHRLVGYRGALPKRILRTSAQAILRVTPRDVARMDGTGTARRLQALAAIGYSHRRIAALCGVNASNVQTWQAGGGTVARSTEARVRGIYDRLSMTPMVGRGPSIARTFAARHGWVPPLAWEHLDIDDPAATPALGLEAPESVGSRADRRAACARLLAAGATVAAAAAEAGVSERTAERVKARVSRPPTAEEAAA